MPHAAVPSLVCPKCGTRHVPEKPVHPGEVHATPCLGCGQLIKFQSLADTRSVVKFMVNGQQCMVEGGHAIDPFFMLNDYLRDTLGLTGTKVMCQEAGCGVCVVAATIKDPGSSATSTRALCSCITPLLSCDGWDITTVEGLGNRRAGYHVIQKQLADKNGSQCGYCSPGMVMSGYGLFKDKPHASDQEIENSFDGNICRCTGYRAILVAMKSVPSSCKKLTDIEDLKGSACQASKVNPADKVPDQLPVYRVCSDDIIWVRPTTLSSLLDAVEQYKQKVVRLVVGNSLVGVYKGDGPWDVWIDTQAVPDLYRVSQTSTAVEFGANVSLQTMIQTFEAASASKGFQHLAVFAEHLKKVANTPVRNMVCWAGNLMIKHAHHEFPSDVFVILTTAGATISIADKKSTITVSPEVFLVTDMSARVIVKVSVPSLTNDQGFSNYIQSYKVMPRSQNVHSYVSAGFSFLVDAEEKFTVVEAPKIIFAGVGKEFVHATRAENFITKKSLLDTKVLSELLMILQQELAPDSGPLLPGADYLRSTAINLFYRFILHTLGSKVPDARLRSGAAGILRGLHGGKQDYDAPDKSLLPVTQPMSKVTAINQTAGEAQYVPDIPSYPGQLYAAFALSKQGNATIKSIDPTKALSQPGVVAYISATDIPKGGINNFVPPSFSKTAEELFATTRVEYGGQAVGMIVADSQHHAVKAARMVQINFSDVQPPVTDMQEAIKKKMMWPRPDPAQLVQGDASKAIAGSAHKLKGTVTMGTQYHFTMETQSCVAVPKENLMEVYAGTQWPDGVQAAIANVLAVPASQVCVSVARIGGGYGSKLTRNQQISAGCALAAHVTNKPVKMVTQFNANMELVGKRYPYYAEYEVGFTDAGVLTGISVDIYGDCGSSPNDPAVGLVMLTIDNCYYCPNWNLQAYNVRTHTPSNTWCRAPSYTPGIFIMESIMEHVAHSLGKRPIDVKKLNFYNKQQLTPYKQPMPYFNLANILDQINQSAAYDARIQQVEAFNKSNRWHKRGLSVVPMKYGVGWLGAAFNVIVSIFNNEGSVAIAHGGIEMGQGVNTKACQVCAHSLGIPMDLVTVRPTQDLPNANSQQSGGSITSELCCLGVEKCCQELQTRIDVLRKKLSPGTAWKDVIAACYKQGVDLTARYFVFPTQSGSEPFRYNTYGVTMAEVELDVLTGESKVCRVDILYDCGQSVNPEIDVGQIEGAFVMGLGYWTMERIVYDPQTGRNLTDGTWDYHPPTSKDIPEDFRISLLKNSPNPIKTVRSKIVGEPPLCMSSAVLFALREAVYAAREELGNKDFVSVGPPATVDKIQQMCLQGIQELVIQ